MNVTELIVGNRAIVMPNPNVKEVVTIKAILPNGKVSVKRCNGALDSVPATAIMKMFD